MADKTTHYAASGPIGGIYFVTIVGAAVYFIQQSNSFWEVIVAVLKAFVWPGIVVYDVLSLLKA